MVFVGVWAFSYGRGTPVTRVSLHKTLTRVCPTPFSCLCDDCIILDRGAESSYRGTSLIINNPPVGLYSTTIPGARWWPKVGGFFL